MTEVSWASEYVGLSFVDGGRDRRGVDCWGLVRLVYWERLKMPLDDFAAIKATDIRGVARAIVSSIDSREWLPVMRGAEQEFDVVVMRGHAGGVAVPAHVGIVAPYASVLHVEHGTDAVAPRLVSHTVKDRICGIYRHHVIAGR
jgi:cell wall-associated NlpC family hydrolase